MNWRTSKLGNHFDIKHGYAFKSKYFDTSGNYIVLTPGNFYEEGGFKTRTNEKYYSTEPPEDFILKKGDLIIAMTEQAEGLLGSSAIIPQDNFYLHNQRLGLVVNINEKTINKPFLYYLFNTQMIRDSIRATATGLKVRHTAPNRILNIEVNLPNVVTQKKIAEILSTYDNAIANNNQRIALLEESIHKLYKEWFVRLRFPGYESVKVVDGVPEGWEKKTLKDIVTLNYGKSLTKKDRKGGSIPVYGSSGIVGYHDKALIKGSGIILGRKGSIGKLYWCPKPFYPIDTVYYINGNEVSFFLYHTLSNLSFISTDAAVPGLNRNYAYSLPVLLPLKSLIEKFEELAIPIYKQISHLQARNNLLITARDLLLPRLMNGKITV